MYDALISAIAWNEKYNSCIIEYLYCYVFMCLGEYRELQASHFSVPGKLMELKVKNIFRCMEDRKVIITSQQGIYKWETCA